MKIKLLLLSLFVSITCFSQFSKTHYIPPLSNSDSQEPQGQYLYISCPSLTPVNYKIIAIGGGIVTGVVSRDLPAKFEIGSGFDTQLLVNASDVGSVRNNKGYIVEAEDLVYVTVRLTSTPLNYQAGGLVSKGLAALGTRFRVGAFINTGVANTSDNHYTFASILATENNTVVSFGDIKPGVSLVNDAGSGNTPANVTLNSGESYVIAVHGPLDANRDGLIGASITSNKPIAVNCGSFAGSNGTTSNLDLGFDQIVSAERTGKEYIFIKGNGQDVTERPLIIANENNTEIYLNGSATAVATLNAGEYLALSGSDFSGNGNLYVRTSKNVFAYQGIGGTSDQANQNMHFLPPLSCETPKIINNIPFINEVGGNLVNFNGTVCIVTGTGATLNFIINAVNYTLASLPTAGITVNGPFAVNGNPNYQTYTFEGLTGNVSVFSSESVYLSYFGSSGAATYGGFYSGFTFKPEIAFNKIATTAENCIPNVKLAVNNLTGFDVFQWYFNETAIPGAVSNEYNPTQPGYYHVKATISSCGTSLESDRIPVSDCPTNLDGDLANDNIDIDDDNDGITNCTESFGSQNINLTNSAAGIVTAGTYSNTFSGTVTNSVPAAATPFTSNADGSFIMEMPAGKGYYVAYNLNFAQPANISLEYPAVANAADLLNANAEYVVNSDTNKTITVLNPTNQLLIDTNYDGIYESGVTQFSSFEIRFRLNGNVPLAAGTGTFKFQSYQVSNFKITHKNLLDSAGNKSTFKFVATCIPNDTDGDGIPNQLDTDSDNDAIPDSTEAQVNAAAVFANTDTNLDGLDNAYEPGITPIDTDTDGVPDYLDTDSDNDGIYDLDESIADTDADGIKNYRELDSDNDLCNDVVEAGYLDPNADGLLGNNPVTVNANGQVTSAAGYVAPNNNYTIAAPIAITAQPAVSPICELQNTSITVADNGGNTYQWEVSADGVLWNPIANDATYSGATTNTLAVTAATNAMNGYKYRVRLDKTGNSCGLLSADATLTIYPLPVVNDVTIVQCDDDLDLITSFNLTIKNDIISANFAAETFTYYKTLAGANTADPAQLIANPIAFVNTTSPTQVWARIVNANGCFNVAKINLVVSVSNIPQTYSYVIPPVCDDTLAPDGTVSGDIAINRRDGIATFDFAVAETDPVNGILQQLPPPASNYVIKYYKNETDALAIQNEITNISNYRNNCTGCQNQQDIWVRVENVIGEGCFGLGPFIKLAVEALPKANPVTIQNQCDDDHDGILTFNTATLEATLLGSQSLANVSVTYFDQANNPLPSPFPATFTTATQTIKARLTNNTPQACYDETAITFTVDATPQAFAPTTLIATVCDDEADPVLQNGSYPFATATMESEIINGQTGVTITYIDASGNPLTDAVGNLIVSPFPAVFMSPTQTIRAIVRSNTNSNCTASIAIPFVVNPVPNIKLLDDKIICTNIPSFSVTIDAGLLDPNSQNNYNYNWSLDGGATPAVTTYSQVVSTTGVYTVEVEDKITGCSRTRTITVAQSDVATILPADIEDLVDENTVTINISGPGDYWYSLDEEFGPFQQSNIFTEVIAGIHTVYVKDINGCGTVSKEIYVLGTPKFFTPNGDGIHDFWNVQGISAQSNANTVIYIFNRFGKLLKQITPLGAGWDGTFNGIQMPADDYWFTVTFENGRTAKGHFALKR
ncbi:T9SS type B sorting domain-containing protein [Flavobacterium humi]|uniref:T9SS type B sorting domain-containing protein n=1 Tax=Flavobacterium humi TaxID=2562683 RepID=A0A4Z0L720_9FLAO|nr:T9SS type B sorting domain-containing protein [Flavobacterium humi]TGD58083.1 T9SS type B sorting domain-containing protein [Flavobacterium humi]